MAIDQDMDAQSRQNLHAAFVTEAAPHVDALFATAIRLTKNVGDAEDLVQESMLKAYRYFDKYEQGTNCKAWLFKIMTNTFINRYRRQQKRQEFLVDEEFRPLQERAVAPEDNPLHQFFGSEETMFAKLFGDEVKSALEDIPVDFRMVVLLADLQDFAYKDIADIMDCPIGTVMSRLYRGRRMLRARLEEYALEQGYIGQAAVAEEQDEDDGDDHGNTTSLAEYRQRRAQG